MQYIPTERSNEHSERFGITSSEVIVFYTPGEICFTEDIEKREGALLSVNKGLKVVVLNKKKTYISTLNG